MRKEVDLLELFVILFWSPTADLAFSKKGALESELLKLRWSLSAADRKTASRIIELQTALKNAADRKEISRIRSEIAPLAVELYSKQRQL